MPWTSSTTIDRLRLQVLPPGECQQALGQGRPALRALHRAVDEAQKLGRLRHMPAQQIEIADHRHQQVVEVVGDAAGELADRFHLLGLAQLLFDTLGFSQVARDGGEVHGLARRRIIGSGRSRDGR